MTIDSGALAEADATTYGIGFTIDGVHIDPARVTVYTRPSDGDEVAEVSASLILDALGVASLSELRNLVSAGRDARDGNLLVRVGGELRIRITHADPKVVRVNVDTTTPGAGDFGFRSETEIAIVRSLLRRHIARGPLSADDAPMGRVLDLLSRLEALPPDWTGKTPSGAGTGGRTPEKAS